jgi:hypothetical integral membrane protein (TIGR02206 family)
MDGIFGRAWSGEPFVLFGTWHLFALGLIVVVNIIMVIWGRKATENSRRTFRWVLAGILLVDEALWHLWNITTGQWSVQTTLPFHLCSVFVFLSAFMLIKKSYGVYEYAYFLGIAGATQALLTPDAGMYGFPHFRAFQVMISHGAIVTAAVYMTLVEGFRPTWQSLRRILIGGNLYMAAIFVLNLLIGSNYLFIAHKPATASLMDVLPPWPVYIIFVELIGVVVSLLLYLPFFLSDLRRKRAKVEPVI